MSENYSVITDINAGNSVAVINQLIESIMRVETAIAKVSAKSISPKVDNPNLSNFFAACDKAEAKVIKVKSQIEPPTTIGGGFSSFLNAEKGKFANVGREMGQSMQMGMQQQFGMAGGMATSFASALGPIGIAAGVAAVGVGVLATASVTLAKEWQTMMAGVSKTTGVEGAELDALGSKLQDIRMQTGATAESITSAVVTAGSIGIPTAELAEFAQVALQMGSAFSMSSDEAASGIAAIGNSVKPAGESWTEFANKSGSSINVLADTMRTSETQIITGMKHLSGTFGLLKPPEDTIPAWQALVATIQSLGLEGDSAGESLKDAATYITRNEKNKISDLLGISGAQLQMDVRSNAPELFQRIALAINALDPEKQGEALKAFGQTGGQGIGMLMGDIDPLTGGFTKLGAAIKTSEGAWKDATSLSAAYEKSQATLDASLSKLTATLAVAGTKLGTVTLPMITSLVDQLTAGAKAAVEFGDAVGSTLDKYQNVDIVDAAKDYLGITPLSTDTTEVSAAEMGKQTASVYTDYVNQGIQAGNFDPVSGKMKEIGKDAGKGAASAFGQTYLDNLKEYMKTNSPEVAMLLGSGGWVDSQGRTVTGVSDTATALSMAASQSGGQNKLKRTDQAMSILGEQYTLRQTELNNTVQSFWKGPDDNVWKEIESSGTDTSEAIADAYYKDLKGSIKSSASFMKTQYSGMGDDLGNVMADGIFKPMEKKQLEVYDKLLDIYKEEFPLEFGVEGAKLQADIQAAIKGPWSVDVTVKSVFEDFTSVAYREKYQYEQKDFFKKLTPKEADSWMDTLSYADEIIQHPESYSADQLRTAQDTKTYMGLAVTSINDGTVATKGIWGVSSQALGKFDALIDAVGRLGADLGKAVAENIKSGNAVGEYYPYAYAGAPGETKRTPVANPFAKVATKQPTLLEDFFNDVLPKFHSGGQTITGGVASLSPNELVVPIEDLKGLFPTYTKADKSSMQYLMGEKMFEDYPGPTITKPLSYQWSQYPNPPTVAETNTQYKQTAWLSDRQTTSDDMYTNEIRAMQLASIGKSQVIPWFARGDIKQPSWWTEVATKLSPQYAENWAANKGGTVPKIGTDSAIGSTANVKPNALLTGSTAWATIYDDSGTCIGYNLPDKSANIHLTPVKKSFDAAAWAGIYDNDGTCIGHVPVTPDMNLGFVPGTGYEVGGKRVTGSITSDAQIPKMLSRIEDNTAEGNEILTTKLDILAMGIFETAGALKFPERGTSGDRTQTFGTPSPAEDWSAWNAIYDNNGTCIAFVEPDPSLNFVPNPDYQKGGYRLGNMGQRQSLGDSDVQGWDPVISEMQEAQKKADAAAKDTSKIEKNTATSAKELQKQTSVAYQNQAAIQSFGVGGGNGWFDKASGAYGSVLVQNTVSSNPSSDWGSSGGASGWMSAATPGFTWAEGGISRGVTSITPGGNIFAEKPGLVEAFVPISDRAAGLRILPQVMRELGVRQFAKGGFSGSQSISAAIGLGNINLGGITINNPPRNMNTKQLAKEVVAQVEAKFYKARKH